MGAWIGIALISKLKKIVKGFVGIASAPDFTKEIMWKNFSKKTKSMIKSGKLIICQALMKPLSYIQKINIR